MVYIDDFDFPYGRMLMCHMVADTTEEFLKMVDKIGVDRKWIQYPGTYNEHFDICKAKKKLAISFGAKEVSIMELGQILAKRPGSPFYEAAKVESTIKSL